MSVESAEAREMLADRLSDERRDADALLRRWYEWATKLENVSAASIQRVKELIGDTATYLDKSDPVRESPCPKCGTTVQNVSPAYPRVRECVRCGYLWNASTVRPVTPLLCTCPRLYGDAGDFRGLGTSEDCDLHGHNEGPRTARAKWGMP